LQIYPGTGGAAKLCGHPQLWLWQAFPKDNEPVRLNAICFGAALLEPHKSIRHKGLKISGLSREDVRRRY